MASESANLSIFGAQIVARKSGPPKWGVWAMGMLYTLGITIISGVCLMTLGLSRPIFANEGALNSPPPDVSRQGAKEVSWEALWEASLAKKYAKLQVARPAQGIAHVKMVKYIEGKPVRINILEVNAKVNKNLVIKPQIAGNTLPNKAQITSIARKNNGIAAVNAGYFKPQSGVPLGTLMIDGKMLTGPIYNRTGIGISQNNGETNFVMGRIGLSIEIKNKSFAIKADNINQPRMLSTYTLVYTPDWGEFSPPAPKYGSVMAVENGKMLAVSSAEGIRIPKNGFVISAPQDVIKKIITEKNLELEIKLPENFENVNHIVSGGPYLVKDGAVYVDVNEQKLQSITGKNPRSAIGYTKDGVLIIVTVDGREEQSVGVTLWQLASMMKSLGCENAMNLDGGGSSVMYVQGRITNSPPQQGGIALSNALVVSEGLTTLAARQELR